MNNLAIYRKHNKMTQTQLGKLIGVSRNTISNYEREIYKINYKTATKICKIFNQNITEIFGDKFEIDETIDYSIQNVFLLASLYFLTDSKTIHKELLALEDKYSRDPKI